MITYYYYYYSSRAVMVVINIAITNTDISAICGTGYQRSDLPATSLTNRKPNLTHATLPYLGFLSESVVS